MIHRQIDAWTKREGHQRLRWLGKEVLHILLTFVIGVAIATLYHELITNKNFRSTIERVCTLYGRDEQECKDGIDDILDESDGVVDNNLNIKGAAAVDYRDNRAFRNYGTIRLVGDDWEEKRYKFIIKGG